MLPAATWYEKHDISTTDMHPFVHSFNPAIAPPWETRTDFDVFKTIAEAFSRLAAEHLGTRTDVIAAPLLHDTADELAQPGGVVRDWKRGECDPIPGVTMPQTGYRRARLRRGRSEDGGPRAARRHAGHRGQGRQLEADRGGRACSGAPTGGCAAAWPTGGRN